MTLRKRGILLLVAQLLLVLAVAGKFLYERAVCPRVWARAGQYDPNLPLRGRYLALQVVVDACSLPRDQAHFIRGYQYGPGRAYLGSWRWPVTLIAKDGRLTAKLISGQSPWQSDALYVTQQEGASCDGLSLSTISNYFIPDSAKSPFPLKPGEALWVEVTVPPAGPPRPIQLALSSSEGWRPLHFN